MKKYLLSVYGLFKTSKNSMFVRVKRHKTLNGAIYMHCTIHRNLPELLLFVPGCVPAIGHYSDDTSQLTILHNKHQRDIVQNRVQPSLIQFQVIPFVVNLYI